MVHPSYVIEHAIRSFYHHWHCGLQPSINVKTLLNGTVCVSSSVTVIPPNANTPSPSYSSGGRKSGRNSRKKRQHKRSQTQVLRSESEVILLSEQEETEARSKVIQVEAETCLNSPVISNETDCNFPTLDINSTIDQTLYSATVVDSAVQAVKESDDASCNTETFSSSQPRNLSISRCEVTNIPPRPIYHPAIINASKAFFKKHPCDLSEAEVAKFKCYLQRKKELGEPVETDIIYQPTSPRNCLHCGHPT